MSKSKISESKSSGRKIKSDLMRKLEVKLEVEIKVNLEVKLHRSKAKK